MKRIKLLIAISPLLLLPGCVGWKTYPPTIAPKQASAVPSDAINQRPLNELMIVALKYVAGRYPAAGTDSPAFAINCPEGTSRRTYDFVARNVSDYAQPVTPENQHLPTYHVKRVSVRGNEAKVEVLRPAVEYGADAEGMPIYQGMTLTIRGGLQPWRVTHRRTWSPGTLKVPSLHYDGHYEQAIEDNKAAKAAAAKQEAEDAAREKAEAKARKAEQEAAKKQAAEQEKAEQEKPADNSPPSSSSAPAGEVDESASPEGVPSDKTAKDDGQPTL